MVGVVATGLAKGLLAKEMMMEEEPSLQCNLSLAVDCTLSLGSALSRAVEAPATRLSRAGSPDPELALSLSVRSERVDAAAAASRHHDRSDQDMSWGSSCIRSDSDATPEYYPPVQERVVRVSDGARRSFKAWPRSSAQSYKEEATTSKALFGMIDDHKFSRASRQPWLSSYLPSSAAVAEAKADSQCMQESDSFARVCAHCGTSKTPLWRNGPGGPKSLCNACGIRFKKAGRRSAANGDSQASPPPVTTTKVAKRKLADEDQQYWVFPADTKPRKRSRGAALQQQRASDSLLAGSCMTWQPSLLYSPKSPLQRDFSPSPPSEKESFSSDEEEGAVLLMALSCGMVNA